MTAPSTSESGRLAPRRTCLASSLSAFEHLRHAALQGHALSDDSQLRLRQPSAIQLTKQVLVPEARQAPHAQGLRHLTHNLKARARQAWWRRIYTTEGGQHTHAPVGGDAVTLGQHLAETRPIACGAVHGVTHVLNCVPAKRSQRQSRGKLSVLPTASVVAVPVAPAL